MRLPVCLIPGLLLAACTAEDGARIRELPVVDLAERCVEGDLRWSPGPTETLDGLWAVPVDLDTVEAQVSFDPSGQQAWAEAVVRFQVGPDGGMPWLDLRQRLQVVRLDGEPVPVEDFAPHPFTADAAEDLRVLERVLPPCSWHTLELAYELNSPDANEARDVVYAADAVRFDTWSSDLNAGRYLEQWLPTNLVHDRFTLDLDVEVLSDRVHEVLSNGTVTELGPNRWRLDFASTYTSLSPMLVIGPRGDFVGEVRTVVLDDGYEVEVGVYATAAAEPIDLADVRARIEVALAEHRRDYGPDVHDGRFVSLVWDERRAMEYDGATTTTLAALEHEVLHSWFGRGVRPATASAGWLDEAYVTWATHRDEPFLEVGLDPLEDPPVRLEDDQPFRRSTPPGSYREGRRLFAHLATLTGGADGVRERMGGFYRNHAPDPATTQDFVRFMACEDEDPEVTYALWRWVYGRAGGPTEGWPGC